MWNFKETIPAELELKIRAFDGLLILLVGLIYSSLLVGLIYYLVGLSFTKGFIHGLILGVFLGVFSYLFIYLNNSFILPKVKSILLWWVFSALLSFFTGIISFFLAYMTLSYFQAELPYFLKKSEYLFTLAIIIGVLTYLTGFLIFLFVHMRNRKEAYLRKAIEADFLSTLKLMNLHFLSNSLHTLLEFIELNPKLAEVFVKDLSQFFRKVLTSQRMIPLKDELNFLLTYVNIERIRKDRIIQINQNIDQLTLDILIPAFTLQPLIENAITHGLPEKKDKPLTIWLEAKLIGEILQIKVKNDGRPITNFSPKAGLNLLQKRLELVGGRLYLESKEPPCFVVEISKRELKNKYESTNR